MCMLTITQDTYLTQVPLVGPLISGIVYADAKQGWTILLSYGAALLILCSVLNVFYCGERPIASRCRRRQETEPQPDKA